MRSLTLARSLLAITLRSRAIAIAAEAATEASVAAPVVADETHDVVITEPDAVPEVEPEHMPLAPEDVELIDPFRRAGFKAVPVTEGPFAGKAFYYVTDQQAMPAVTHSEPHVADSG